MCVPEACGLGIGELRAVSGVENGSVVDEIRLQQVGHTNCGKEQAPQLAQCRATRAEDCWATHHRAVLKWCWGS
jgi:hypothetical protein